MTSRGSRRRLLSGNELKERGRREAPLLFVNEPFNSVLNPVAVLSRLQLTSLSAHLGWQGIAGLYVSEQSGEKIRECVLSAT